MSEVARRSYGLARVCAVKAGLRRTVSLPRGTAVVVVPEKLPTLPEVFRELLTAYRIVRRGYPALAPLLDALFIRYELANLLLALRGILRRRAIEEWKELWWPLGDAGILTIDRVSQCARPSELSALMHRTALAPIAPLIAQADAATLGSATLAAERYVATRIAAEGESLGDHDARALVTLLLLEHDLDWLWRAPSLAGLTPAVAARGTTVLHRQLTSSALSTLTKWLTGDGTTASVPNRWSWAKSANDPQALLVALRRHRRGACQRAFVGHPFSLAFPLAVLLLKEEELRAVAALNETGASPTAWARACAGSLMGA